MNKRTPGHYPVLTTDTIRYGDTDCQGHVNNAVFSTFIETGRSEILYRQQPPVYPEGTQFVIARLEIDYLREILWPGEVVCGTAVAKVGNSSVRLVQSLISPAAPPKNNALSSLTPRELEILGYLAAGHSNKVIARRLDLAESTSRT